MTQHRTTARKVVVSISCFAYGKRLCLLPKSKVGGIPGPEAYHKKYAQRRCLCRNSLLNEDFRLTVSASTKSKKARFSSNSMFKLQFYLQTAFFKFYLQLQSPRFFHQIVQFQVMENLLKKSKIK